MPCLARAASRCCLLALVAPGLAQQSFLGALQEPTGLWSATRFGGEPEAELRVHALILLSLLGDGSTTTNGPDRFVLQKGIRWLQSRQDADGRFALRSDPGWLLDHAMATYAVVEAVRRGPRTEVNTVEAAVAATQGLAGEVARGRPAPAAEVRLWCELVERSLRRSLAVLAGTRGAVAQRGAAAASVLAAALASQPAVEPASERDRAAAVLLAQMRGEAVQPAALPERILDDPLLSFYIAAVRFRLGGQHWRDSSRSLGEVVKAQRSDPPARGFWDPQGAFGAHHGQLGTSAVAILLLELYYRYCKLDVAGD